MSYKSCFPRRSSINAWFSNCKCIRMMSHWYFQVGKLPSTKTGCQEQSSEPKYTPKPSSCSGGCSQWLDWSLAQVWYVWDGKRWGRHSPLFPRTYPYRCPLSSLCPYLVMLWGIQLARGWFLGTMWTCPLPLKKGGRIKFSLKLLEIGSLCTGHPMYGISSHSWVLSTPTVHPTWQVWIMAAWQTSSQSKQLIQSPSTAAALERQNKLHEQFGRAAIQWEI